MAFLRSGKFFRFLSAGKNLVNFREYEASHQLPATSCVCMAKNFATISASIPNQTLENSLKRLDQDVRRSGRISRRDLEEILDEIRTNKTATSSQSLLVIRCCGNLVPEEMPEVRTKMVQEIWKTLSKLNVPMDISHYNALLRVYLENEYSFSPTDFLADLQSKGVEPNRVTYQRLISRYCQQGDIDGATQILEFMREKQLPVNENVFNALIMGHSNADDLESATGILGVMTQAGLEPSADTYTTLLCGFARKGDVASINKFVAQCEEKDVFLLDKDYLEVVYALAVNGHENKIDDVLNFMKKAFGYNQDAVNTILRLINRGQEAAALKILKTMPRGTRMTGELSDAGNFLIKQLIKANRPVEQIMSICTELEESNMNSRSILTALEAALSSGKAKIATQLLKEMKARDIEVRQHYFWPIFCAAKNEKEVLEIMTMMQTEFELSPNNQTIRDFIIPKLMNNDYEGIIQILRTNGITTATSVSTVAHNALLKRDLLKAAEIMSSYEAYYSPGLFRKPLLTAVSQTQDLKNYVLVLRQIHHNLSRSNALGRKADKEEEEEEHEETEVNVVDAPVRNEKSLKELQADVIGDLVLDAVVHFKTNRVEIVTQILQGVIEQGLSISSYKAQRIQDRIGEAMTAEMSEMLGKLTSGELEPLPYEKQKMSKVDGGRLMDADGYERLIARLEEKGENTKSLKRQMLVAAIRSKDIPKTEEIFERLKGEGYTFTAGVYAQLVELYASADKIEEALNAYKKVKETDPEFGLDEVKTVKVLQAYINLDRLDDGLNFLRENKLKNTADEKSFNYQTTCWRLLNTLAEKGQTANLTKLFDALVENNYIVPNNVLLGPLIKVHLVNDELKEAVDKFEQICQKHRATPWKNEIACRLIQAEDATSLQRITDLSTEIHGEVNSLYDLVFSFIECGRVRQARKILETPGLRTRPARINYACERFLNEGMPTALEGLIEATKDLSHIDRAEIYYSLLQNYIKEVEPEKALGLWTAMQEEDITPSDGFLFKLSNFLKSQGQEVPFHVPATAPKPTKAVEPQPPKEKKEPERRILKPARTEATPSSETHGALKTALKSGEINAVLAAQQNLATTDKITLTERSQIIEILVQNQKIQKATKLLFEMLDENVHPIPRIFRFYLNRLAASGDSEMLEKVGQRLTPEVKKLLSFDNRVCHSFIAGGKAEDYLKRLEDAIDNATTAEEIAKAGEAFPRGGSIGIIDESPDHIPRFEQIAEKYAAKKVLGPINVLWMQLFINSDPRAEDVFQKHLTDAPRLMFQRIIQTGREKQDANLVERLITLLHETKVSEGAVGNAYSCLLDIYATKNDDTACLKTIDACIKEVCFENVNKTALLRAKECVEKAGKKFPHKIPEKKTLNKGDSSSSSSSSSSDDEVTRKEKS